MFNDKFYYLLSFSQEDVRPYIRDKFKMHELLPPDSPPPAPVPQHRPSLLPASHHLHTTVRLFSHKFRKTLSNLLGNNALMILYIQVFFFFLFHIQSFGTLSKLLFIILLHQVEFRNSNRHHLLVYFIFCNFRILYLFFMYLVFYMIFFFFFSPSFFHLLQCLFILHRY